MLLIDSSINNCVIITITEVTYKCTISVQGFPPSTKEAKSKKDAQTLAAWEFSETLVDMGKVGRGDLPPKPECVGKRGCQEKITLILACVMLEVFTKIKVSPPWVRVNRCHFVDHGVMCAYRAILWFEWVLLIWHT